MEDFIKYIITPLLSQPEGLEISTQPGAIVVKVADDDVGRVIGKQGNVVNAIRTLLKTYCAVRQIPPANLILKTPPAPAPATPQES
jgi:predicted RNA-binding protein YlqC (UPF0109 family)